MTTEYTDTDYFSDLSLAGDPHPYFHYLQNRGPVIELPRHNVVAVTDFDTAVEIWQDTENYSACNAVTGPIPPLPFTPGEQDISPEIEANRYRMPFGEELLTLDQPRHTPLRALIMRLFTPRRLKEIESFIGDLADRLIEPIAARGHCEMFRDYAEPFSALVIADLLGVPEEDRGSFHKNPDLSPSRIGADKTGEIYNPLEIRKALFLEYIADRRRNPRGDILSELANAIYADGTIPEPLDVVRVASLLFGASQDTTAHLLTTSLKILAEKPSIQTGLRNNPEQIPAFIEEVLRFDGPVKATFRMARKPVKIHDVAISPGTTVMLATAALNRDPHHFDNPQTFQPGRRRGNQHLSFGRGIHMCPGAQLARTEARISLEHLLSGLNPIAIDEQWHGAAGARHFDYAPTYIFRALASLHLTFTISGESVGLR